ncbi:MAG: AAA family ATPase, partial [bacterium]
ELDLKPLNIFIGPNGSGKSNLIDVFSLLKEAATITQDENSLFAAVVKKRGGMAELLWNHGEESQKMMFEIETDLGKQTEQALIFKLELEQRIKGSAHYDIITDILDILSKGERETLCKFGKGIPISARRPMYSGVEKLDELVITQIDIPEPKQFISSWRIYLDFDTSPEAPMRNPQMVSTEKYLSYKGDNLPLVLQYLQQLKEWTDIDKTLKDLYEYFDGITFASESRGKIVLAWREKGLNEAIYAPHLSDGILRFLCLAAILCHPDPPPLICIDEPEIGFHPDILLVIAELMKKASEKTQLIVTTHSPEFVSCFDDPETIIITERGEDGGTIFRRLSAEELKPWLEEEKMPIGTIWRQNLFGGNRW